MGCPKRFTCPSPRPCTHFCAVTPKGWVVFLQCLSLRSWRKPRAESKRCGHKLSVSFCQYKVTWHLYGTVSWSQDCGVEHKSLLKHMTCKALHEFPFYSSCLIPGHGLLTDCQHQNRYPSQTFSFNITWFFFFFGVYSFLFLKCYHSFLLVNTMFSANTRCDFFLEASVVPPS